MPGKAGMLQPASTGKVSMLLSVLYPLPPVITSPAMGKLYVIQTTNGRLSLNQLEQCAQLKALQMIITSWANVSLAGGGFGKVEEVEVEDQEKEEKSRQGHRQERNLGLTMVIN